MRYLQACIKESLRLHPAVGFSLPRVVPEGGYKIGKTFVPAGVSGMLLSLVQNDA
jgi:cytochrome P450